LAGSFDWGGDILGVSDRDWRGGRMARYESNGPFSLVLELMTWGVVIDYVLAAVCVLMIGSLTLALGWLVVTTWRENRQFERARNLRVERYILTLAAIRAMLAVWSERRRRLS
jgi:hypothetical protein